MRPKEHEFITEIEKDEVLKDTFLSELQSLSQATVDSCKDESKKEFLQIVFTLKELCDSESIDHESLSYFKKLEQMHKTKATEAPSPSEAFYLDDANKVRSFCESMISSSVPEKYSQWSAKKLMAFIHPKSIRSYLDTIEGASMKKGEALCIAKANPEACQELMHNTSLSLTAVE